MKARNYAAFLLRLWREQDSAPWRATLQDPHTGERRSFGSLARLVAYLEEQTGERWLSPEAPAADGSCGASDDLEA
jgi:hypothetical protein